ncbi:MAG: hypothetical protein AAF467_09895 [Actinomycetota bacterium]
MPSTELGPLLDGVTGQAALALGDDAAAGAGEAVEYAIVSCPNSSADALAFARDPAFFAFSGIWSFWQLGEQPPQRVIDWLIDRAYSSIEVPGPVGQSAPFGDVDVPMITQLPTWLWIDDAIWQPVSVNPGAVFGYSVTATATPANATFSSNTGDAVDCGANTGEVYDLDRPSDEQASDCTLTFRDSSNVGDWTLTNTITWDVTYVCAPGCGTGTRPSLVVETTRPVRVAELQALLVPVDS